MSLYHRCLLELTKPDMIEIHKNDLEMLPVSAKTAILSLLCKRGYFKDTSILKHLVNSTVYDVDFGECVVTDDMLKCLHVCVNIRKLDLGLRRKQERHITTNALILLLRIFKFLEVLIIPDCIEFNDEVMKVVCENCKGLRLLSIQNSRVTNNGLFLIGENLNFLSVLNLSGTRINDRGIGYLLIGPLVNTLREVNIAKCSKVTAAGTIKLVRRCENLQIFTCGPNPEGTAYFETLYNMRQVFWKV